MSALTGAASLVELRSSMVSSGRSVAGAGTAGGAAVGGVCRSSSNASSVSWGNREVLHTNLEGGIKARDVDDINVDFISSSSLQQTLACS